jgi:glycerophosphoryl diester phosphodiesterase
MIKIALSLLTLLAAPAFSPVAPAYRPDNDLSQVNGGRPLLDAHNCYPYDGRFENRIDRALGTGFPVGIEQDIAPYTDPKTGEVIAKVTHRSEANESDPTLRAYFFEKVRPQIEKALKGGDKSKWPLIVLHFDFKNNSAPTLEAVWKLLGEYQDWITTTDKTANDSELRKLDWKPLLVLTEDNPVQEQIFYRKVAVGDKLRLFGSAHLNDKALQGLNAKQKAHALTNAAPDILLPTPATNYRRWWNNSWWEVEEGGQQHAGDWTEADNSRLQALVDHAHRMGYMIRFYTLDGFTPAEDQGWGNYYNFGSLAGVQKRWKAALADGVDMIATDQYEALRKFMNGSGADRRP